jgi:hypothetical protein
MKYLRKLTVVAVITAFAALIPFYARSKEDQPKDKQKKEEKKENPWVLKKDKEGIKVFVRNVEGIEFKEFMGVAVLETPIEKINAIMGDVPNQVNWMCDMIESKVVKADPVNPIQYNVITAPLVSNRDIVIQTRVVKSPGKIVRYFQGITVDSIPPRKGIVRMPKMVGKWMFESIGKNQTRVTYQNLADPGGSLPAGLVNLTVVKQPFVSIDGMRKQLSNPKFK